MLRFLKWQIGRYCESVTFFLRRFCPFGNQLRQRMIRVAGTYHCFAIAVTSVHVVKHVRYTENTWDSVNKSANLTLSTQGLFPCGFCRLFFLGYCRHFSRTTAGSRPCRQNHTYRRGKWFFLSQNDFSSMSESSLSGCSPNVIKNSLVLILFFGPLSIEYVFVQPLNGLELEFAVIGKALQTAFQLQFFFQKKGRLKTCNTFKVPQWD